MKRIILLLAVVLVVSAVAAPGALAAQAFGKYGYLYDQELQAFHLYPSKKDCEQAQANDPNALSECIKIKN